MPHLAIAKPAAAPLPLARSAKLASMPQSIVALCAEHARLTKEGTTLSRRAQALRERVMASMPALDKRITQRALRNDEDFSDLPRNDRDYVYGGDARTGIPVHIIETAIREASRPRYCTPAKTPAGMVLHLHAKPLPTSAETKARIARLKQRLALAQSRQAEYARRLAAAGEPALEKASEQAYTRSYRIERKIVAQRSRNDADREGCPLQIRPRRLRERASWSDQASGIDQPRRAGAHHTSRWRYPSQSQRARRLNPEGQAMEMSRVTVQPVVPALSTPSTCDPIFDLIAKHREVAEQINAISLQASAGADVDEGMEAALLDEIDVRAWALIDNPPTTVEGVTALLRYSVIADELVDFGWPDGEGAGRNAKVWSDELRRVLAEALERIITMRALSRISELDARAT
jgi:hypothetical protein